MGVMLSGLTELIIYSTILVNTIHVYCTTDETATDLPITLVFFCFGHCKVITRPPANKPLYLLYHMYSTSEA